MDTSLWRNNSRSSKIFSDTDSEDEIPDSRTNSHEDVSKISKSFWSRRKADPTIIADTDSEGESENEDIVDHVSDSEDKVNNKTLVDSTIEDEYNDTIGDETMEHTINDDTDDEDYDHSGNNSSDSDSDNLPIQRFSRAKKLQIKDSSSDEETGNNKIPHEEKQKLSRAKKLQIEDSSSEEEIGNNENPHKEKSGHITLDDSDVIIENDTEIKHSTIVDIDDSTNDEDSSDHLPLSISNSSAPDIALSLAKEEASTSGADYINLQQEILQRSKLQQLKSDLMKAKTLYKTANRELLPDHGEKLRLNIASLEKKMQDCSFELERMSMSNNSRTSFSNSINDESLELSRKISISSNDESLGALQKIRSEFDLSTEAKADKEMGKKALATFEKQQALTVERITHLQQSLNRCPEENEKAEDPRGLKTKLMPHQKHALAWLLWREKEKPPGGILADDMGLGKTLTMISLVVATKDESYSDGSESEEDDNMWSNHKKFGHPKGGTLVICPASLLDQWQNEVTNRCRRGVLTVEVHHGPRRETVAKRLARNDMVITTYQIVSSEFKRMSALFKIRWKRIILDEAHVIRNHSGKIAEAACFLLARNRWTLTGTPIQNKEQDLYSLLKFLRVSPFNDLQVWKRWVDNKNSTGLKRLATVTKTLMLRRTKQELIAKGTLDELPEKITTCISIDLDPEETKIYQAVLAFSKNLFAQFLAQRAEKKHEWDLNLGKFDKPSYIANIPDSHFAAAQKHLLGRKGEDVKAHHILVLILRLRQICCHPGLIKEMLSKEEVETNGMTNEDNEDVDDLTSQVNNLTLFENQENENDNDGSLFSLKNRLFDFNRQSSKIKAILNTVEEILEKREKMIIVSQWTSMLGIISEHLSSIEGAQHEMFSGSIPIKKRQPIVDRFNDPNDDLLILLLSLTAGGVGLNLIGGNHLLLIDIHWNPQLESQAQDRVYRFGQRKNVHIYKFLCNETIEQRVKQLQDKKLGLAEDIFTGHRRTSSKLTLDDLKSIFEM